MGKKGKILFGFLGGLLLSGWFGVRAYAFYLPATTFISPPDSLETAVMLQAETGKTKVYQGEPITLRYWLYHRIPVIDPQQEIPVKFENCHVEEFPAQTVSQTEKRQGKTYQKVLLKKLLIIPQQAGTVKIPAIRQVFKMNAPPDPADFFGVERVISQEVRSPVRQLIVQDLPAPKDSIFFSGAIGKFTLESGYMPDDKHPNLLTFTLKVKGTGNLKNLKFAPPEVLPGVEIFNEAGSGTQKLEKENLQSEHLLTYQVMTHYRGKYTLPARQFSYFDPEKALYVTLQVPEFRWEVKTGPAAPVTQKPEVNPNTAAGPFLVKASLGLENTNRILTGYFLPVWLVLASGVFFLFGFIMAEQNRRQEKDRANYQFRKARRQALKKFEQLRKLGGKLEEDAFSRNLIQIFKTYVAAKTYQDPDAISPETLGILLKNHRVPEIEIAAATEFLKRQYAIRFAGALASGESNLTALENGKQLVNRLEPYFHG